MVQACAKAGLVRSARDQFALMMTGFMSRARLTVAVAIGLFAAMIASRAHAQSTDNNEAEIALLKQQLRSVEQKLDELQKQTVANAHAAAAANSRAASVAGVNAATPVKGPTAPSDVVVKLPNNRPTFCTADDQNCIAITSRLHFDAGGYDYRPNSAATVPQRLDDGVNARRARIGVIGKLFGDWNYALIYDFAGSSDGFASTASVRGATVGFLPGGALSGIENAYLSYTGFKPFGGKLAIEGGVMDLPYTLDEASSSNDIPFMERAASGIAATNIAAGDFRSTAGARWYTDTFWAGAYATGPATGAIHSASSINPPGTTEQFGAFARVAGQIVSGKDYSLHIGGDAEWLIHPPHNLIANTQTLTLSDRPEVRIDPTTLVSTGALAGVSGAQVYSAEAAGTYGPLFFQGEYFWFNVDRNAFAPLPSLRFQGGYAEAAWVLTGETRLYNPGSASYGGIAPANPFSLTSGGWGAWEIAGRVSTIDLNDQLAAANGVAKQISATNAGNASSKFDAFAMRTQVAF